MKLIAKKFLFIKLGFEEPLLKILFLTMFFILVILLMTVELTPQISWDQCGFTLKLQKVGLQTWQIGQKKLALQNTTT